MKHGSAFDQKVFADILADILDTSKESLKERVPATWSLYSLGFLQHLKLSSVRPKPNIRPKFSAKSAEIFGKIGRNIRPKVSAILPNIRPDK